MATSRSRSVHAALLSLGIALVCAPEALAQQQYRLQHTTTMDLSAVFFGAGAGGVPPASDNGSNPLTVAFDGTSAYVGGFNNGTAVGSVGIVKVNNVVSLSPTLADLVGTRFSANPSRGINGLAFGGGSLYALYDSGATGDSFIAKYDTAGAQQWQRLDPGAGIARAFAMSYDPGAAGGNAQVAFLGFGQGRVASLDPANGNSIKTFSGGADPGGIILGTPVNMGNTWRAVDFDAEGNIAISAEKGYQYGLRSAQAVWTTLGATPQLTSTVLDKAPDGAGVGQGIAILENLLGGTSDLLAVSGRTLTTGDTDFALTFTDSTSVVQTADARDVHLRRTDGTTTGLVQTTLTGNEDGIGAARFGSEIKEVFAGTDASGLPVLLVASFIDRRLDTYTLEPTWNVPGGGNWSASGNWLLGAVPNSALANARFGSAIAAPAIVTVDGPKTVKVLRFDNANSYTLNPGGGAATITLDSPGTPIIEVLQGSHTVNVPIQLNKDTTVTTAVGSTLSAKHFRGAGLSIGDSSVRILPDGTASGRSTVTSLSVGLGGKLNITNNAFVVDYVDDTPFPSIRAMIVAGYNGGGASAWTGNGITTSNGDSNHFAIGYAEASALGMIPTIFGTVDATSVLFRETRYGDADLSGNVNLSDFNKLASNFGQTGKFWTDGDFNYDGNVNLGDFNLLASNFGLAAIGHDPTPQDWSNLAAAVPEPSALLLPGVPALAGMCLRRRNR